jgi:murein DD-endopeptidase MepM/ murein hydrolase activator NlpD
MRAQRSSARFWSRAAMLALTVGVAGCSGDTSRFGDQSPYRGNPEATGSLPPAQAAPVSRIESRPLPAQTAQVAPVQSAEGSSSVGVAGGGRGLASYAPASYGSAPASPPRPTVPTNPEVTGSVAAPPPKPASSWSWEGGAAIIVAPGETIETIAHRHGVPASAIMQANNIAAPGSIHPGQHLVIPRYHAAGVAGAAPVTRGAVAPGAHKPVAASLAGNPGVHVVARGETLSKISHLYGKSVTDIAKANNITATAKLNIGDRLVIPGVRVSTAKPKVTPAVAQAKPAPVAPEPAPVQTASLVAPTAEAPIAKDPVKSAESTGSLPKFRWPANGRVIATYGPTPNGQQNDGINIALPENTPIKSAEDGVVAYAGNELKGYGNLVLVRHPNGYVTAYAHAKELLVKRGDPVKRGQVIARSGQTGNVNAPQLHFEIRKGASPLDPTKFLSGA